MKKLLSGLLVVGFLVSGASVASADGIRSAIKQSSFAETVVGGEAQLQVPGSSYINAIAGKIYPEFFVTMNSVNGSTFDGGVILDGTQWKAVIFGGGAWKEVNLSSITGKKVKLRFAGEQDSRGEYIVKLAVTDSSTGSAIGSVFVDRFTTTSTGGTLGWLAENPYYAGLNTVGYELNMVPTSSLATSYYHRTTDSLGRRAFFDGAEMSVAVPVKKAGGTLTLDKFVWSHTKNSDDLQYTQADVETMVYDVSNQTYLYTSMDFNNLP